MSSWTFIARSQCLVTKLKGQDDTLARGDPTGDLKLKLIPVNHSENPRALQNYANLIVPVLYK